MYTDYNVTFNNIKGTKTMNFKGYMTLKEMFSQYAISLGESEKTTSNYVFIAEGKLLNSNSNEILLNSLNRHVTILVLDEDALGKNEEEKQKDPIYKIKRKQFRIKICRNYVDEILTDMAIFGFLTK